MTDQTSETTPDALDVAAVKALAESALMPMTCGGHKSFGSLLQCAECNARRISSEELGRALTPRAVLGLLRQLDAVREARDANGYLALQAERDLDAAKAELAALATADADGDTATCDMEGCGYTAHESQFVTRDGVTRCYVCEWGERAPADADATEGEA